VGRGYGTKTHTLTTPEIPSHQHVLETNYSNNNNAHSHQSGGNKVADATTNQAGTATDHSTQAAGGGAAHNNVQPSRAVLWCIKT
jgi:microcystin-dependent protein